MTVLAILLVGIGLCAAIAPTAALIAATRHLGRADRRDRLEAE